MENYGNIECNENGAQIDFTTTGDGQTMIIELKMMCVKYFFRKDVLNQWTKTALINTPTTKLKKRQQVQYSTKIKNIQTPTGKILHEISTLISNSNRTYHKTHQDFIKYIICE